MRILVVEDEKRLAEALSQILIEEKYMVDVVYNGKDGYEYALSNIYDVIILDVMLPFMNGFSVTKELRKNGIITPILLLTAKNEISDKVYGLDLGADDYVTKPFSPEELLARVRVLSRRKGEIILDEIKFKDLVYKKTSMDLLCTKTNKHIQLSFKEAELITILLSNPNIIIEKEELITKIWGYDSNATDNNVEAYISFLRKKLNHIGSNIEIITIKRVGYKLEETDVKETED